MNSINFYAASALFNGLFGFFLVYYIYLRNRRNPLNRSFLFFGIAVSGWSVIYSLWGWSTDPKVAEFFLRRHMMFAAMIPVTLFHFTIHFTKQFHQFKKWLISFYVVSAAYSVGMLTPLMISGVKETLIFQNWPARGPLLASHVVFFFIVTLFAYALLVIRFFKTSGTERRQTLWLLLAIGIGFGGGCTNWFLWFDILIPPMTNFFVGLMFGMIAYAIVRYGLMDVDFVVEMLRASRTAMLGLTASSINHELRNPLYIAKGKIESQLDAIERQSFESTEAETKKSREVLQVACDQLARAMDIMQKFSNFARPNAKQEQKEAVVIREVLQDVLALVSNEFELNKIQLDDSQVNGAVVTANRRQLEEVFFNLIMNACQAMKNEPRTMSHVPRKGDAPSAMNQEPREGNEPRTMPHESREKKEGKENLFLRGTWCVDRGASAVDHGTVSQISISAAQKNNYVLISISDTGPGISKENQRRIFEPFYSTKGEKGTGLGLYITKQLVERNGGKISVRSKPGEGTHFTLELVPA